MANGIYSFNGEEMVIVGYGPDGRPVYADPGTAQFYPQGGQYDFSGLPIGAVGRSQFGLPVYGYQAQMPQGATTNPQQELRETLAAEGWSPEEIDRTLALLPAGVDTLEQFEKRGFMNLARTYRGDEFITAINQLEDVQTSPAFQGVRDAVATAEAEEYAEQRPILGEALEQTPYWEAPDIEMPEGFQAPEYPEYSYQDLPTYQPGEYVPGAELQFPTDEPEFYGLGEGDYQALEESIYESYMRPARRELGRAAAQRGLEAGATDVDRALAEASLGAGERAVGARIGLQAEEQARRTGFGERQRARLGEEALALWQAKEAQAASQRQFEQSERTQELLAEQARIAAANEAARRQASERYGAQLGAWEAGLGYRERTAGRRSQEAMGRTLAAHQDWLAALGEAPAYGAGYSTAVQPWTRQYMAEGPSQTSAFWGGFGGSLAGSAGRYGAQGYGG
jgi:hypothetical protein